MNKARAKLIRRGHRVANLSPYRNKHVSNEGTVTFADRQHFNVKWDSAPRWIFPYEIDNPADVGPLVMLLEFPQQQESPHAP